MKHYVDENGQVFAYGDDEVVTGKRLLQDSEVEAARDAWAQKQISAMDYKQQRRMHYPDLLDYIDGLVKGDQAQIDAYLDACRAVKTMFPKK